MPIDIPKVDEVTTSSEESKADKSERLLSTIEIKAKETFISFRNKIEKMFSKESSEEKDTSSHDSKISTLKTTSKDREEVDTISIENEDLDGDGGEEVEDEEVEDEGEYRDDEVGDGEDYWDDDESEEDSEEEVDDEDSEEEDDEDYWDEEDEDPDEEVDDEEDGEEDEESDEDEDSAHNNRYLEKIKRLGFPESVDEIEATTYLGGSSGVMAGFVGGDPEASEMFVVKKARLIEGTSEENTDQLVTELLTNEIYKALGFNVPDSVIYNGGSSMVSKFIPGKDLRAIKDPEYKEEIAKEIRKGFVLDCLLGNWDVIGGLGGDNIRVGLDGKVYRIDNGGSMQYRARGELKENFGSRVIELDTMRERNSIFSTITDSEIFAQIEYLVENMGKIFETFDAVLDELGIYNYNYWGLRSVLIQRLVYLDKYPAIKSYMDSLKGYFEEFYRNEGISIETMNAIKKNIENAVENNWDTYVKAAEHNHLSTLEFLDKFQKKVEKLTESSRIFRATDVKVLENILLRDGRFKSQFETGTSGGTLDPGRRTEVEEAMFGYAKDLPPTERPIYCYSSDAEHGEINSLGKNPPPNNTNLYGRVTIMLKKDVENRATITGQDSLDTYDEHPPTPYKCPHPVSFSINGWSFSLINDLTSTSVTKKYYEVQILGGLSASDIEKIYVSMHNGMSEGDIKLVKDIVEEYNTMHPDNKIILEEY